MKQFRIRIAIYDGLYLALAALVLVYILHPTIQRVADKLTPTVDVHIEVVSAP